MGGKKKTLLIENESLVSRYITEMVLSRHSPAPVYSASQPLSQLLERIMESIESATWPFLTSPLTADIQMKRK